MVVMVTLVQEVVVVAVQQQSVLMLLLVLLVLVGLEQQMILQDQIQHTLAAVEVVLQHVDLFHKQVELVVLAVVELEV
tara:strand:- start:41 stop:274 length:234 start_codon:yes stop_codon:yes gene_type:complete